MPPLIPYAIVPAENSSSKGTRMHIILALLILFFFTASVTPPTPEEQDTIYDLEDWTIVIKSVCGELQNASYYRVSDDRHLVIVVHTYRGLLVTIDEHDSDDTSTRAVSSGWHEYDTESLSDIERDLLTESAYKKSGGDAAYRTYTTCKEYTKQDSFRRFQMALEEMNKQFFEENPLPTFELELE